MKTILVATDFSDAASNAACYAADMAVAINAHLLLLHIYEIPMAYLEVPVIANFNELDETAQSQMNKLKEELIKRTMGNINIASQVKTGTFFRELKTTCENINPYVVVMGSQGTTMADHLLFGRHTIHVMKSLQWPLITVPAHLAYASIKKIGLACDMDKIAATVPVSAIKMMVNEFKAELHVINTGDKERFAPDIISQSMLLEEKLLPMKTHFHFIAHDNIDEGIIAFAEKNNIDLLIALPKRHGIVEKLIHKSHTKQFILYSHVPVLVLHR